MTHDPVPIRDAATLVLVRGGDAPRVLMGLRGEAASFMPSKFVFPGGALDPEDATLAVGDAPNGPCAARLAAEAPGAPPPAAFARAAIRETFEETGLRLARPGAAPPPPATDPSWVGFLADGATPAVSALRFVFRAVTPPTLPKRFDARFFAASAAAVLGDPDDFARAGGELSHLTWAPLSEARGFELPFITAVVLAELQAILDAGWDPASGAPPPDRPVPFFDHTAERSRFRTL